MKRKLTLLSVALSLSVAASEVAAISGGSIASCAAFMPNQCVECVWDHAHACAEESDGIPALEAACWSLGTAWQDYCTGNGPRPVNP